MIKKEFNIEFFIKDINDDNFMEVIFLDCDIKMKFKERYEIYEAKFEKYCLYVKASAVSKMFREKEKNRLLLKLCKIGVKNNLFNYKSHSKGIMYIIPPELRETIQHPYEIDPSWIIDHKLPDPHPIAIKTIFNSEDIEIYKF